MASILCDMSLAYKVISSYLKSTWTRGRGYEHSILSFVEAVTHLIYNDMAIFSRGWRWGSSKLAQTLVGKGMP